MRVAQRTFHDPEAAQRSSFGRKWHVGGVTKFPQTFDRAAIEMTRDVETRAYVLRSATQHERGHVSVAEDCESFDMLTGYDRWQAEVEAWLRGHRVFGDFDTGTLILDALNTYRRSLGVSEEEWETGRQAVLGSLCTDTATRDALYEYEPLEPDPDDSPPDCMQDGGAMSDYDDDDYGEDSEDWADGPDEPEPQGPPDPGYLGDRPSFDAGWNDPAAIQALHRGVPAADVARDLGLDVGAMTPLARAMAEASQKG